MEGVIINKMINLEITYQEITKHFITPVLEDLCGDDFIFQHNSAPTYKSTKNWLGQHQLNVPPWLANSPDLNPIENLWGIIKKRLPDIASNKS